MGIGPYGVFRDKKAVQIISMNLKLGGIDKCLGGVNMREAQIHIEKH